MMRELRFGYACGVPAPEASPAASTRGARRRAQTRARLLGAARELFARHGVEATRINEITELADVGFGSFYNHFSDKDEIVEAVLRDSTETQGAAVEALTSGFSDPAEVVAVAHRHFVRLAREDPTWGWLLVRLDVSHRLVREALGPRALRDLQLGVKAGRFDIPDLGVTLSATGGALLGVMRAVLDGELDQRADERHAENVLRMLGLPRDEAARIARRRLPIPPRD
jgi:AcrR family transcriptional regulator